MKGLILKISAIVFIAFLGMSGLYAQDTQDLVQQCASKAGDDATYLKDFVVKLDGAPNGSRSPMYRQSLALRKNITYRFSLCNKKSSEGEAVLRVYDQANLILSTWYPASGKEYNIINFQCKKSGVYTVVISFKEGKQGEAVGVVLC